MTTPHKATPEQWANVERWASEMRSTDSCLLELRDRIQALEAAANSSAGPTSSPAPAGDLMHSVGAAICSIADCGDTPSNWAPEARAAILAVAGWLEHRKPGALHCAALLREEVERHA
jgi:hypothetical protein